MASEMPAAYVRKSQATMILVLGILGIVCCNILGPIAWYLGKQELDRIQAGEVDPNTEGMARAGMILGIIGTVIMALALIWVVFFGGLAILSSFSG